MIFIRSGSINGMDGLVDKSRPEHNIARYSAAQS
jgi:hypothetical protein